MKFLSYIYKSKNIKHKTRKMAVIMALIAVVFVSFSMCFNVFASTQDDNSSDDPSLAGFVFSNIEEGELDEFGDLIGKNLRVGYVDDFYPFSYDDKGDFGGLARRMFDAISYRYGMNFTYYRYKRPAEANKALNNGDLDIIAFYGGSMESLEKYDLLLTKNYAKAPLVVIQKENGRSDIPDICATTHYLFDETTAGINIDKYAIELFNSERDCLDAVAEDHAKITVCNGYLSQYLRSNDFNYNELAITAILSVDYEVCAVVSEDNASLLKLMNLVVPTISDRAINEFTLESISGTVFNVRYFVVKYGWIAVLAAFIILIAVLVAVYHMLRNSRRVQKLLYMDAQMNIWNLNYLRYIGAKRLMNSDPKAKYALCCINLGKFRQINLVYGFERGTAVLELLVKTFRAKLDVKKEIYCRDHGDKFVIMIEYNDRKHLVKKLNDIMRDADARIYEAMDTHIPIQIGVYEIDPDVEISLALDYAMQAMGAIKDSKVSEFKIYDEELKQQIKEAHKKQKELDEKSIKDDFVTFYQAKVDINSGNVVGAEALVRMKDPDNPGRVLSPGLFVPYYEQTGFITEIDFFVYEDVCRMLAERIAKGKTVVTVSVNFSRLHFVKKDFPNKVEAVLEKYSIPKNLIEVEITETLAMEQMQDQLIQETVDELEKRGIRISIDDFGSGYSSLGIIERIPASVIKLDRSFLLNRKDKSRQIALMKGIVGMAIDLHAQIVCEGVETKDDVELMKVIGASVAQGYFYSKPAPQSEFIKLLEAQANG